MSEKPARQSSEIPSTPKNATRSRADDGDLRWRARPDLVTATVLIVLAAGGYAAAEGLISIWGLLDHPGLLIGQDLGLDAIQAELAGHRLGRRPIVPGEHNEPDAIAAENLHRLGGGVLDRVGHAQQARRLAVDHHEHDRLAFGAEPVGLIGQPTRLDLEILQQGAVAQGHVAIGHAALGKERKSSRIKVDGTFRKHRREYSAGTRE
jgi:hypothetical protein